VTRGRGSRGGEADAFKDLPGPRPGSSGGVSRERDPARELIIEMSLFGEIAAGAAAESSLWEDALRPPGAREELPVFSPLVSEPRFARGLETIYEGYLLHYGRSRLFDPPDDDVTLLLGDALLAQGLVLVARTGSVAAVSDLAELLALCTQGRADGTDGDGAAWAATAALVGAGGLEGARAELRDARDAAPLERLARATAGDEAVDVALAAHASRLV
jgi:hypothetical protein